MLEVEALMSNMNGVGQPTPGNDTVACTLGQDSGNEESWNSSGLANVGCIFVGSLQPVSLLRASYLRVQGLYAPDVADYALEGFLVVLRSCLVTRRIC